MHSIIGLGLRGFLLIFSAVVLGLSITLAKHQINGAPPTETSFASFTGAFGLVTAAVGVAALFFDSLPSLVPLVADGLTAVFFLAGGIALAVAINGTSCTDNSDVSQFTRYNNKILNGGCASANNQLVCGVETGVTTREQMDNELKARCVRTQADFAFQFIAFSTSLGALALTFLNAKRSGAVVA